MDFYHVWTSSSDPKQLEHEYHEIRWWEIVIHPLNPVRAFWDLMTILLILYTVWVVPFRRERQRRPCCCLPPAAARADASFAVSCRVAFFWQLDKSGRHSTAMQQFEDWDTSVDFFFLMDVLLNFNTGYIILRDQVGKVASYGTILIHSGVLCWGGGSSDPLSPKHCCQPRCVLCRSL